jgi:glucose uptake protein
MRENTASGEKRILALAFFVTLLQGLNQITSEIFWSLFIGGLIWAVSGYCAFTATHKIGLLRASGTWSPLNIVVSLFWDAASPSRNWRWWSMR